MTPRRLCMFTVALAGMLAMAGCTSTRSTSSTKMAASAWPERRPLYDETDTFQPPDQPSTPEAAKPPELFEPEGSLSLRQAIALTLLKNPSLQGFAWEVRAAEAEQFQAGLWENPEIEFEMDNFSGSGELSGTDATEFQISLGQTLPLGGDIRLRRKRAGDMARLAGWDYEAARIAVLTDLTRAYVEVLARQQRLDVSRQALDLAESVLSTTQKRVEAGAAPPIDELRARVQVTQARIKLKHAQRDLETARKSLALLWGQSVPKFKSAEGNLDHISKPPTHRSLARLIDNSPDVARWAVEIIVRQTEEDLARAELFPDLTVGLGAKKLNETGENAFLAGVSLPFPLFDRRQGDIRAARNRREAAVARRKEARLTLSRRLAGAYAVLANAHDEALALREEALPAANEAFELTQRAFDQGNVAFIDVLDAERTLVELREQYVAALAGYHAAVAEIEGLIGQSLNTIPKKLRRIKQ